MKNNHVFAQTFVAPAGSSELSIGYHIYMMFLSFLSIKDVHPNVKFYLITNQESYHYVKDFPYDEILVSLDSYGKALKPSFNKLHSIDIFKGESLVHFDNDVFIFKPIALDFNDVLVQSDESNFMNFFWRCKLSHHDLHWVFPDYAGEINGNYNPGTFGFTKHSIVREDYYAEAVFYHNENVKMLEALQEGLVKSILISRLQDIFAMIEEGFLFHFVRKKSAEITFVIPDKYPDKQSWGDPKIGFKDFEGWNLEVPNYRAPYCDDYVHFMGWSTERLDYVQPYIDRVYKNNKEVVNEYFGIKV